jgi:hypothetical protein
MRLPRLSRSRSTPRPDLQVVAAPPDAATDVPSDSPLSLLDDYTIEPPKLVPPPRRLDLNRLGHDELITVALDCGFRPFAMNEQQLRAKLESLRQDRRAA